MPDPRVLDLGLEAASRVLETVAEPGMGFAVADLDGEIIWNSDCEPDLHVVRSVKSRLCEEVAIDHATVALGDRGRLCLGPICEIGETPLAWLIAWSDDEIGDLDNRPSHSWKRVCETLPRVAQMLSRECALASELSGAVTELGDRYEELNIVYRMERETRGAEPHVDVVRSMLDGFLSHLRIDVGMLVANKLDRNIAGRGTNREIPNADLVITELEGKVWRFISTSKMPLVMNDLSDDRRGYLLTNLPFKMLAIPHKGCGEADGGLILLRHQDQPDFTNSDMSLARVFFGQSMMLLHNQSLLHKMKRFTRQIASSLVETVEAKDPYTRGHSERVERITAGLGRDQDVSGKDFDDMLWGALLHDIGKIGVPDAILMKPDRLTDDEYTFIKTHPNRSFEILSHVEQLGPAALDAARYHQERFDGTGYPFGLTGGEIPLVARIVAVADTYDAVTSSRSYRAASSHEEAMEIIHNVSGIQLDPDLVSSFVRQIEKNEDWLNAIRPAPPSQVLG